MTYSINISKFTLEKPPEHYDDVFGVIDAYAIKDIAYNTAVFSDQLVNSYYENNFSEMNIMIAVDMSRGQIHEMFFTPMRVAWAMDKTVNIMVTDLCNNQDAVVEHLKLVHDICGIPPSKTDHSFVEEVALSNEIVEELIAEEKKGK